MYSTELVQKIINLRLKGTPRKEIAIAVGLSPSKIKYILQHNKVYLTKEQILNNLKAAQTPEVQARKSIKMKQTCIKNPEMVENRKNKTLKTWIKKREIPGIDLSIYKFCKDKKCNKKGQPLPLSEFNSDVNKYDGLRGICRNCDNNKSNEYRKNNLKKVTENHDRWYEANKSKVTQRRRHVYHTDPLVKLTVTLRNRLRSALKGKAKTGSAIKDLGCSIKELKVHLEKQFYPNPETGELMTFQNHGKCGWHIDHIIPLVSAKTSDELIELCHYTNLQPLWAKDNYVKHDHIIIKEI